MEGGTNVEAVAVQNRQIKRVVESVFIHMLSILRMAVKLLKEISVRI